MPPQGQSGRDGGRGYQAGTKEVIVRLRCQSRCEGDGMTADENAGNGVESNNSSIKKMYGRNE